MGRPSVPALAAELTDHIIDFLHDDKRTLSACALTHPTWLAASRFHLFNTITVDVDGGNKDRIGTLEEFSGVGGTSMPALSYVRTVRVVSMVSEHRTSRLEDAASLYQRMIRRYERHPLPESGKSSGSSSSSATTDLPTIHLCLGRYCDLGEGVGILRALSDKVTRLEFSSPILSRRDDLWPFVSSFPNLRSIQVLDLAFHHYGDRVNKLPPQPGLKRLPLSQIRIDTMSMGFVIDSLLAYADALTSLEEFGILYEDVRQTALVTVAEAIQANVKVLRFGANCHPGTEHDRNRRPSAFDISMPEFLSYKIAFSFFFLSALSRDI